MGYCISLSLATWSVFCHSSFHSPGFPGGSVVKNLLPSTEAGLIPGSGRSLEKEMATVSSIAWKIPWTEEPGNPWGCKELDTTERLRILSEHISTHTSTHFCQLCPVFTFSFHILAHLSDKILLTVPSNSILQFIHSMLLQLPIIYSSTQSFIWDDISKAVETVLGTQWVLIKC